uniref:L-type lectin-like domain-containing protein n=1 Tax=Phakopsora pachyrhizi TaxID=170000 RepID=A0A0S1MIK5_PHAPC
MWDGFGVFIDTFPNSRHSYEFPRIIGMANHGYKTYDVGNDGDGQESGACSINVRSPEISTKLKIHYIRGQFLEVLIHHENWNEWDHCFTVFNYTLPESPYLGFSAHTGEVFDNHDIIYASANGLVYHPPKSTHKDSKNKKKNSWFSFSSGSKEKSHNYDYEYDEDSLGAGGIGSGIRLGFWGKLVAYLVWLIKFGFVLGLIGVGLFWGNKFFVKYRKETMKRF